MVVSCYIRMKTTPIYVTPNITAMISRPGCLFYIFLVLVAFSLSIKGDVAVGGAQGDVLMSWRTNLTDISEYRVVVNPSGANIIRFSPDNATGTAVSDYTSKVTNIGNVSLGTVSFRLLNLTVGDAGRYYYKQMFGSNGDGGQVLVIADGPDPGTIKLSPNRTSHEVAESSPLSVTCSADCFPDCQYRWTGPGGSIPSITGMLSIISIGRSQTGQYICTASNSRIPSKTATATISVVVLYGPDDRNVSLSPSNTSYQLPELSPLAVQCDAICVPLCDYQWSGPLVSQNDKIGLLSISQISRSQNGTFTCTVTNPRIPGKSATANLSVTVYYGQAINGLTLSPSKTSYQLTELSPLIIQCSASCVPQCSYQWIGPGISQNDNRGLLSVSQISRNQTGMFTCIVTNPRIPGKSATTSLSVIVYYGPDIPRLSPTITVYTKLEGESVPDIICSADCFPGCTQVWMKEISVVQESSGGTLSLRHVYRDKAGDYTCWFNNTESKATGYTSIKVVVQYPPVLTMKATNTSKGGNVVINCTASGVPDNYIFNKWTHMAPDENRTIVRELDLTRVSNSEVSFTIEGATYQDTGFYVCKASNGITHYSSGQLVMEDMVSILITDQPIITFNARYLAVEKGKPGQMHIEFYSGAIQPIVAWYRLKNSMMEMLQNSSNIGIYLSTLMVELQYYKKTVRLLGYNASLEVFDIQDEHFTSYKVEIYNSFAEPVYQILELKLRGPPDTPTNFHVVLESITAHSLQLIWRAGFHGGASQTFVIEYREVGETNWLYKSEHNQFVLYVTLNTTITDLKEGTTYEFRIYSENIFNRSQISPTVKETTRTDTLGCTNQTTLIASAVLFSLAACLFTAILVLYIRIRKDIYRGCKSDTSKTDQKFSDIGLCQPGDINGLSNFQVDAGRETSNPYEDLSNDIRAAPTYEELSNGSTKHSVSGNHLYSNIVNSSSV